MIGKLSLTEQLAHCEVGVGKELTLYVVPTRNDPGIFEADVQELVGYEHEEPASEPPASEPTGKRGAAPAVAIVIKGKK